MTCFSSRSIIINPILHYFSLKSDFLSDENVFIHAEFKVNYL